MPQRFSRGVAPQLYLQPGNFFDKQAGKSVTRRFRLGRDEDVTIVINYNVWRHNRSARGEFGRISSPCQAGRSPLLLSVH